MCVSGHFLIPFIGTSEITCDLFLFQVGLYPFRYSNTGACRDGTGQPLLKSVEAWRSCPGIRSVHHLSCLLTLHVTQNLDACRRWLVWGFVQAAIAQVPNAQRVFVAGEDWGYLMYAQTASFEMQS
jgi:hypothetical protein